MKKYIICILVVIAYGVNLWATPTYHLQSPNKKILAIISVGDQITYQLEHDKTLILLPSSISMHLNDGHIWGKKIKISGVKRSKVDNLINSPFYQKKEIRDLYNALVLDCGNEFNIEFRAYNEGFTYRFISKRQGIYHIVREQADFVFDKDYRSHIAYPPHGAMNREDKFNTSFEEMYTETSLSGIAENKIIMTPILVDGGDGKKICIAESDVLNYPGMFLSKNADNINTLSGEYAPYPLKMSPRSWDDTFYKVEGYSDYIARCEGVRTFPWRIISIVENDIDLLNNDMVYKLASPSKLKDISWIKPGLATWDYWSNWDGLGERGKTFDNYKKFIDFASARNIPYYIVDAGWAKHGDGKASMLNPRSEINLQELIKYGEKKGVGLILWGGAGSFVGHSMDDICRVHAEMGIKGYKIDFWEYDNQQMMELMEEAARTTAKYNLLLIYHGCTKPTGLERTYPNIVSYEAIKGMEYASTGVVGKYDMVAYNVTFPFIRQVAGPSDYTPGVMKNVPIGKLGHASKESEGTRCQQIALFITVFSPIASICDGPSRYEENEANQKSVEFISRIPTVWDETIPMEGLYGEYLIMARKKGREWFVGGTNNMYARTINLDFSFLPKGNYQIELMRDADDSSVNPQNYIQERINIPENRKMSINMASGGGFAGHIIQK